jgi:hypothetical protein
MSSRRLTQARMLIALIVSSSFLLAPSLAQAFPGGFGTLSGKEKLSIKPACGSDRASQLVAIEISNSGQWMADDGAKVYAGKAKKKNKKATKIQFNFDKASKALLKKVMTAWAADLCGGSVKISSTKYEKSELKLNKKKTQAKAQLRVTAKGKGGGGSGKGKYTITLNGPWTTN